MNMVSFSGMGGTQPRHSGRQIRAWIDGSFAARKKINEQVRRAGSVGNAKSLEAYREPKSGIVREAESGPNQW